MYISGANMYISGANMDM